VDFIFASWNNYRIEVFTRFFHYTNYATVSKVRIHSIDATHYIKHNFAGTATPNRAQKKGL
jgi:hypothetical protein